MESRTHLLINEDLCGTVVELEPGAARVQLVASDVMRVDERGLIHGSFVFGLADYAAMLAVNDPNVVLGAAEVKFLAPIQVGDTIDAEATLQLEQGKKRIVNATARVGEREVFRGEFVAFVLPNHILD